MLPRPQFLRGRGGSGIIVIRYNTTDAANFTITGGTKTTFGSFTVHSFTALGVDALYIF